MNVIPGKVVFVGDTNVGKTSLIYAQNGIEDSTQNTVTASSISCTVNCDGQDVNFSAWDTAGQVNYRCLVPMFVRGAEIAVIVFSMNDNETFQNVQNWLEFLEENCTPKKIYLVGNKNDLEHNVKEEEFEEFASTQSYKFFYTSATTKEGVDVLFEEIARGILESQQKTSQENVSTSINIENQNQQKKSGGGCC